MDFIKIKNYSLKNDIKVFNSMFYWYSWSFQFSTSDALTSFDDIDGAVLSDGCAFKE